jgi:hypothetical protein
MIVVLPLDTIVRILDHAATTSGAAGKVGKRRAPSPGASEAAPTLSKSMIGALKKAKEDKANLVGPLDPSEFNALSAWGRSVGLIEEAEAVEAAVRASG